VAPAFAFRRSERPGSRHCPANPARQPLIFKRFPRCRPAAIRSKAICRGLALWHARHGKPAYIVPGAFLDTEVLANNQAENGVLIDPTETSTYTGESLK